MIACSVKTLAQKAGGTVAHEGALATLHHVSTDTRNLRPGDVFACIKGPSFDGHAFMRQALGLGACGVIAQEPKPAWWPAYAHYVQVADTVKALMALAAAQRDAFAGPVIGITGSHGKTTTKEWLRHFLAPHRAVLANEKNFNNELGVTYTWLALTPATQVAVIEMGMRGLGQIAELCAISRPTMGIVSAVGSAHVGELGGLDRVAQAKAELLAALPEDGLAIFPEGEPGVDFLRAAAGKHVCTVGDGGIGLKARDIELHAHGATTFTLVHEDGEHPCRMPLWGIGQVTNVLLALEAGLALGVPLAAMVADMPTFTGVEERMTAVSVGKHHLLNDAYNASPESMAEALKVVAALSWFENKWLVLGDMLELGQWSGEFHRGLADGVMAANPQAVYLVGPAMQALARELQARNVTFPVTHRETVAQVRPLVADALREAPATLVLVKASHGVGLHQLVRDLRGAAA